MEDFRPTPDQKALIEHSGESLFATAVPGAGKTRTMAQRFIRLTNSSDPGEDYRGVAALSFTRVASEEIDKKVNIDGGNGVSPNFIGTIDSFLRRFLVIPMVKAKLGLVPDFRDEWTEFGELSYFEIPKGVFKNSYLKRASLAEVDLVNQKVPSVLLKKGGFYREGLSREYCRKKVLEKADERRKELNRRGYFDAFSARRVSNYILKKNSYGLIDIIAARFREIILDEAQDCNSTDLLLLNSLHDRGVRLTLIGDLNQDIYKFRGSDAQKVREFCLQRQFKEITMKANFRSTPEICDLVSYLRYGDSVVDAPERPGEGNLIKVFGYDDLSKVADLCDEIDAFDNGRATSTILAATHELVAEASRSKSKKPVTVISKTKRILVGILLLLDAFGSPSQRMRGIRLIETGIIENCEFIDGTEISGRALFEEKALLHGGTTALIALHVAFGVKKCLQDGGRRKAVLNQLIGILNEWGIRPKKAARLLPSGQSWDEVLSSADRTSLNVDAQTIHASKGAEYDRVVLVLNKRSSHSRYESKAEKLLNLLSENEDDEARRLFYVGASRARNELILAVDKQLQSELERLLMMNSITFERINLSHR